MTTTLLVSQGNAWMPKFFVFARILYMIADELRKQSPDLAKFMIDPIDRFPYLNLADLSTGPFQEILKASHAAYNQTTIEPIKQEFGEAREYFLLMDCFSQLKALMASDPRAPTSKAGEIVVRDNVVWNTPGWIHELVLEILAAYPGIRTQYPELSRALLAGRESAETGYFDLRELDTTAYSIVFEVTEEWLKERLVIGGQGPKLCSPPIYEATSAPIETLFLLLQADERLQA